MVWAVISHIHAIALPPGVVFICILNHTHMTKLLLMVLLMMSGTGFCLRQAARPASPKPPAAVTKPAVFAPLDIMK